jgi:hypothetical protein
MSKDTITTFTTEKEITNKTPEDIGAYEGPQKVLKMYHIYHCMNKKYMFTENEHQPRKYIGFVMANDIEEAYSKCQNDHNSLDYIKYNVRSLAIGDIIQDNYGFYMVTNQVFKLLCLVDEDGRE